MELEVKSIEEVPEALRGFYSEDENAEGEKVFKLNLVGIGKKIANHEAVLGEKRAVSEKLSELKTAFGDRDPAETLARLEELEKFEKERTKETATKKGDFEKLKTELDAEHAKDKEAWEGDRVELEKALEKALIETQAASAISSVGGRIKPLLTHIRAAVEVVRLEDGERVVRVIDPDSDGHRAWFKSGDPMTIANLVEEMQDDSDFAPLFDDDGRAASGIPPKGGSGGATPPLKVGNTIMLSQEQAKDVQTYRDARAEADKTGAEIQIADE